MPRQPLTPSWEVGAETSNPSHAQASLLCPQLRLAALNVPLTGDMSGLRGADLQCYRQSQEAQLYGTFRAFLSAPTQDLVSIVKRTDRNLPIVNLKAGTPVPVGLLHPGRAQHLCYGELRGAEGKLLPTRGIAFTAGH